MVSYNPKDWFKLIFAFHRSDTFRRLLPTIMGLAAYSALLAFLSHDLHWLNVDGTTVVHSLLGFVISMLLVFRTNTAYERWWEGRKLWGELVNNSRNLILKIKAIVPESHSEQRQTIKVMVINFVFALKEHLRQGVKHKEFVRHPAMDSILESGVTHVPNAIAGVLFDEVNKLYKAGIITGDQLIILNDELRSFTNISGACERIRNSPIPYSYSLFLKKFIFVYVLTLPFAFLGEFNYWVIAISVFVFYAFASLELIAEEIEDPFGVDANDLPLDSIADRIKHNLNEIIR